MKNKIFITLILSSLLLASCQSEGEVKNMSKAGETEKNNTAKVEAVDHGLPSSNGPTTTPDTVKGPDAPPPADLTPSAQAVTTKENIRLTLPLKSN